MIAVTHLLAGGCTIGKQNIKPVQVEDPVEYLIADALLKVTDNPDAGVVSVVNAMKEEHVSKEARSTDLNNNQIEIADTRATVRWHGPIDKLATLAGHYYGYEVDLGIELQYSPVIISVIADNITLTELSDMATKATNNVAAFRLDHSERVIHVEYDEQARK